MTAPKGFIRVTSALPPDVVEAMGVRDDGQAVGFFYDDRLQHVITVNAAGARADGYEAVLMILIKHVVDKEPRSCASIGEDVDLALLVIPGFEGGYFIGAASALLEHFAATPPAYAPELTTQPPRTTSVPIGEYVVAVSEEERQRVVQVAQWLRARLSPAPAGSPEDASPEGRRVLH